MRMHAAYLSAAGIPVQYLETDHAATMRDVVDVLAQHRDADAVLHYIDPVDDWLERRLVRAAARVQLPLHRHSTPMFLTDSKALAAHFVVRRPSMATFYATQRKAQDILVENGKPVGGRWSFDADNRKRLPPDLALPGFARPRANAYTTEARRYVETRFGANPGHVDDFDYPVTYDDARAWLADFLKHRLAAFGPYEDAVAADDGFVFHSVLTPMLNVGLLTPRAVIDATLEHARHHEISLPSLEGFVRQIIGWREYMRGAYVFKGRSQRVQNFWGHRHALPDAFWTAQTGMPPIDTVISRVLRTGYAHHIERLMLLANFMQLCEFSPDAVYRWFMELFIDAYDWVMVPNVYGMGLYADGGMIVTKPYVAGSNYVLKMSDFKRGPWCDVWDGLFWRFIARHRQVFAGNPRLGMLLGNLDRMPRERRERLNTAAEDYLHRIHA